VTASKKYRFLLAEDNPNDLFLVERAIRKANLPIQLFIVRNGEEAVRYLQGDGIFADRDRYPLPMLVLSNLKMPKMNGLELLAWIRQQPQWQTLPVVIMSTSEDPGSIQQFNSQSDCSYVIKPISQDDLTRLLQDAIARLPPLE